MGSGNDFYRAIRSWPPAWAKISPARIKTSIPFHASGLAASCMALITRTLPFHASAWKAASEPIQLMLDASDVQEQDRLTALWRDNTQSQLSVVCITSALIGGMIASAFTWPALTEIDPSSLAIIQSIWYSALLFAVVAIATATQQAVALSRVCSYPNGFERLRKVLGHYESPRWRPRQLQLYIWQAPIALLNASIYSFVLGLAVVVWSSSSAKSRRVHDPKLVVLFTCALVYAGGTYIITAVGLYHRLART